MRDYSEIMISMRMLTCDTPVPLFDLGVSCGLPTELGDIPAEMLILPGELVRGRQMFIVNAKGDSMEGLRIFDGDQLLFESVRHFVSKDVVLASIDGEVLVKSYYVDDTGRQWLVPSNDKYEPILLREEMNLKFGGRLVCNLRRPCDSATNLSRSVKRYLKQHGEQAGLESRVPSRDEVVRALRLVGQLVTVARWWLGPCRVLMDCKYIHEGRYDTFCQLVREELPSHPKLPVASELQRMSVEGFSKPFTEWREQTAPVHGKNYAGYHEAGQMMLKML